MKGIVKINGQEIEIEINEEQFAQLQVKPKKTGYERVKRDQKYYTPLNSGVVFNNIDNYVNADNQIYDVANYYSDKTVAENNARADKLFRQLRRFAVENRKEELDWDCETNKYYISYEHELETFFTDCNTYWQPFGTIYFDTEETAKKAIETFEDELIWYFTEYKDSL